MLNTLKNAITNFINKPTLIELPHDQDFMVINGSCRVSNKFVTEKIKINGAATFQSDVIFNQTIYVNGSLKASDTIFSAELFANGATQLQRVQLQDNAYICGKLTANDCHILKCLTVYAQQTTLSNCDLQDIVMKSIPFTNVKQIIRLRNGSIVCGDITFESGNGEVYLENGSEVKGEVHGGTKIYF